MQIVYIIRMDQGRGKMNEEERKFVLALSRSFIKLAMKEGYPGTAPTDDKTGGEYWWQEA